MNKKIVNIAVFGFLIASFSQLAIAQNVRSVSLTDLSAQITSEDYDTRLHAVKRYAASPYEYGADGLELVSLALRSSDEAVVEAALVGLRRLVAKGTVSKAVVGSHFGSANAQSISLLHYVGSEDDTIAMSAASAHYAIYGESTELELAAVERFATADNEVTRRDFVRVIAVGGLTTAAGKQLLTEIIESSEASDATILAAQALAKLDPPYLPALEHLVALAKTDEFFAKPSLVRAIGMYGKSGELYLDELRWMRAEVNRQAELPRLDRSRNLHNSSYSLQVLDEVIDRFEHNIRTEG